MIYRIYRVTFIDNIIARIYFIVYTIVFSTLVGLSLPIPTQTFMTSKPFNSLLKLQAIRSNIFSRSFHSSILCHMSKSRNYNWTPSNETTEKTDKTFIKKKVALIIGFIGSNYYGLQYNNDIEKFPTVESKLEMALYRAGYISEDNHMDINKIGWSRSSRTDKGVHAEKLIISVKLHIPLELLNSTKLQGSDDSEYCRLTEIVEKTNEFLPPDIRVFSCVKINQGFIARKACHWREYAYLLPVQLLLNGISDLTSSSLRVEVGDVGETMKRLNVSLNKYVGSKSFHNFHRLNSKKVLNPNDYKDLQDDDEVDAYNESVDEVAEDMNVVNNQADNGINADNDIDSRSNNIDKDVLQQSIPNSDLKDANTGGRETSSFTTKKRMPNSQHKDDATLNALNRIYHEAILGDSFDPADPDPVVRISEDPYINNNWLFRPRVIAPKTYSVIYKCQVNELDPIITIDGQQYFNIVIRGKSFLLHQIRLMISAAVLEVNGFLPSFAIDLGLIAPFEISLPLAPAEGLVLVDSGICRTSDLVKLMAVTPISAGYNGEFTLMTSDECKSSSEFRHKNIYQRVHDDWNRLVPSRLFSQQKYIFDKNQAASRDDHSSDVNTVDNQLTGQSLTQNNNLEAEFTSKLEEYVTLKEDWLNYIDSFKTPPIVLNAWVKLFEFIQRKVKTEESERLLKDQMRIFREVEYFKRSYMNTYDESYQDEKKSLTTRVSDSEVLTGENDKDVKKGKARRKAFPCKKLLTDNLCTDLVIEFGTLPGQESSEALKTLATDMVLGHINPTFSNKNIIEYVKRKGGLKAVAAGYHHPMIE